MHNTITIIGSVHEATQNYSADDLYQKLCEIKPDIVLFEFPLEWEKDLTARITHGEKTGNVESIAFQLYSATHDVTLKPYDIEGRNDYYRDTDFFIESEKFEKAYSDYFKADNPHPYAARYNEIFKELLLMQKHWDKLSMHEINSDECDIVTETYINLSTMLMTAICDLVPELQPYKQGYLTMEGFEAKREKEMVKNILAYNQQYENKSIVVLCGYYHRYTLIKLLKDKQTKEGFTLQ